LPLENHDRIDPRQHIRQRIKTYSEMLWASATSKKENWNIDVAIALESYSE